MQKFNYHTHTYRCNHASSKDEDYVLAAIGAGFKTIGFSDHMPFPNDDGGNSRMYFKQIDDYIDSINKLKVKYQGIIDIKLGFECEYLEELDDYYKYLKSKCDYLILGQHMGKVSPLADYFYHFDDKDREDYERLVIKALRTGYFSYLCHPDFVMVTLNSLNDELMHSFKNIFDVALELDIPVEINFGALNKPKRMIDNKLVYAYPNAKVIELASKMGCKLIYGLDAHRPNDIADFDKRLEIIKDILKDVDYEIYEDFKI